MLIGIVLHRLLEGRKEESPEVILEDLPRVPRHVMERVYKPLLDEPAPVDRKNDTAFQKSLEAAAPRSRFGYVVTQGGSEVCRGNSKNFSCLHELPLWEELKNKGVSDLEIYILEFYSDGKPLIAAMPMITCTLCAEAIKRANIRGIHLPAKDGWEAISPDLALATARRYAMGRT